MSTDLTELGLKKPMAPLAPAPDDAGHAVPITLGSERRAEHLTQFLDRLMEVLAQFAPQHEAADTEAFRAHMAGFRQAIADPRRRTDLPEVAAGCIATCRSYLEGARSYHAEREQELTELIAILRDAARLSVGESAAFHAQVLASSSRFDAIAQLEDIRDLRRRLGQEVGTLREAVAEKQRKDDEAYAQLTRRVETLQEKLAELEVEVSIDQLTRIGNRGHFDRALEKLVGVARESGGALSLAMLDIDHFKAINDTHGHPIGDRVLLCVAQMLSKGVRTTDVVARYGGEEFAVILPGATASEVEERFRTLLVDISKTSYSYDVLGRNEVVRFTVSCGLTDLSSADGTEELIRRADEALYEAKRRGRNRVVARRRSLLGRMLARA